MDKDKELYGGDCAQCRLRNVKNNNIVTGDSESHCKCSYVAIASMYTVCKSPNSE